MKENFLRKNWNKGGEKLSAKAFHPTKISTIFFQFSKPFSKNSHNGQTYATLVELVRDLKENRKNHQINH